MSSNRTRAVYGMQFDGPSGSGGADGPMIDFFGNGVGDFISDLSAYKAQGVRAVLKFVGAPPNYQASDLSFLLPSWKTQMDLAAAKTNAQQMGNFVQDGTLLGNWIMDDCKTGSKVYGGKPPTLEDLDVMAQYSKSKWSQVPVTVRVDNDFLAGKSNWTYLDYGWCQWHERFGTPLTWFTNNVVSGRAVGLGLMTGFNLLNGGSGLTAPWNFSPNHQAGSFGMSPLELDAVTTALSENTYAIGVYGWAAASNFDKDDYYSRSDIQVSLTQMKNVMVGRLAGPVNWRDSGSTDTGGGGTVIGGNWSIRDDGIGTTARYNNQTNCVISPPNNYQANDLHCLLVYSRDSGRSVVAPSGWSQVQRVSGNSAQGGDLALFSKIGTGAVENAVTLVFHGAGGDGVGVAGTSQLARWFVMSNNTAVQAGLVNATGSAGTWTSKTGMGSVPGITSTISDSLILICAARANDFGGGSVDENKMSATSSPPVWGRLLATGSAVGVDAGMFVDYAATSGITTIPAKSWSQTSGAEAGAGAGFMVSFAPNSIVSGTAPIIDTGTEPDFTLSVGSLLSFQITSGGSTPITYSKDSGPSNVTIGASSGLFNFTPLSVDTYVVVVAATNSFGSDRAGFNIFAVTSGSGANVAPAITNPGNKSVAAHDLLSFIVQATDSDGDPVTLRLLSGAPTGAFLDSATGQFVWIPSGAQGPGTYPIVIGASDGRLESLSTFTVTVADTPWTRDGGPSTQRGHASPTNQFRRV